jgi:segregation and condensation protein B
MTRRKRTKAAGSDRAPVSDTIAPPPLDASDIGESEATEGPVKGPRGEVEAESAERGAGGARAEPSDRADREHEEVQLDLSLAVPPDDELEETLGAEPREAAAEPTAASETPAPEISTIDDAGPPSSPGLEIEEARDLTREHLRGLLEALIFAADKPMSTGELAKMASAPLKQVRALLAELKPHYAGRGIVLDEVAGGWLFRTNAQFAPFVRELTSERPVKLTRAQVETLAIAAYRQPITRPEIDEIRGVDSGATLKLLLERDLVRILGKKDEPGRPLLYGTTTHFLEFFGLKSLRDLPTLREFTELSDESRRVAEAELGEVLGEAPMSPPAATADAEPGPDSPAPPAESHTPVGTAEERAVEDGADAPPLGFDDELERTHDTVIPTAPPTGEVDDPDGPTFDEE